MFSDEPIVPLCDARAPFQCETGTKINAIKNHKSISYECSQQCYRRPYLYVVVVQFKFLVWFVWFVNGVNRAAIGPVQRDVIQINGHYTTITSSPHIVECTLTNTYRCRIESKGILRCCWWVDDRCAAFCVARMILWNLHSNEFHRTLTNWCCWWACASARVIGIANDAIAITS